MKNNLLEYLSKNKNHKLHNFFKISKDYTKITSSIDQKEKTIYGNTNIRLEELGRELFLKMDPRISKSNNLKKYIIEEKNNIDNRPADLILVDKEMKDYLLSTTEFKSIKSNETKNFNSDVETYFQQTENYSKNLIKDKYHKTKETFCSIVLIDVEKIILDPSLIDLYNNSIDFSIKNDINKSLSIYGLYVETRKYIYETERLKKTNIKSFNIAVIDTFYKNNFFSVEEALEGCSLWTKKAIDANDSITFSSALGLGNLRETLSPLENIQKEQLVFDMLETLTTGFNKKDLLCLNKHSNSKSFVFIKNETIVLECEKKENNKSKVLFVSTEGALIDGQQSTSIPFFIKDTLLREDIKDEKHLKVKMKIKAFLKKESNIISKEDIEEFIKFISNCSFNYNLSIEKDKEKIKFICQSKNNNIPVDKEDNFFLINGSKYKFLSNKIQEKTGYLCLFPNVSQKFTDKNKTLNVKIIPAIFNWYIQFKSGKKETPIYSFINGCKKILLNHNTKNLINHIIDVKEIDSKKTKDLKDDILALETQIKDGKTRLSEKELDLKIEPEAEIYIKKEINKIKTLLENFISEKKEKEILLTEESLKNMTEFIILDEKIEVINKLITVLIMINNVIKKEKNLISNLEIRENIDLLVMRFILAKHKEKFFEETTEESIYDILDRLVTLKELYNLQWTEFHNKGDEKLKETIFKKPNSTGTITIIEAFEEIFNK